MRIIFNYCPKITTKGLGVSEKKKENGFNHIAFCAFLKESCINKILYVVLNSLCFSLLVLEVSLLKLCFGEVLIKWPNLSCSHFFIVSLYEEAEKHLSDMVVSRALVSKIDQPAAKDSNAILNSWAVTLEKLLDLVEKSCNQIHKETMVRKPVKSLSRF